MNNHYFPDGKVNVRAVRHDLRGLLMPFDTAIKCISAGDIENGLNLQRQILAKLKIIAEALTENPESASKPTAEGG